jgi:heme/copper-type cytochrome/quinol oxidase subunit 2
MTRIRRTPAIIFGCLTASVAGAVWASVAAAPRERDQVRDISIEANDYAFSPAQIEIQKDDVVKVTFHARDIAHSFTIDDYRIAKRAAAGQRVVFEFRADQPGRFRYYCNLTQDERCKKMQGELIVK